MKKISNILLILAVIMWGFSFISIKFCVEVLSPVVLSFYRFSIAAGVLFMLLKLKEPNAKLSLKHTPQIIISGIIGITIYYFTESKGLKYVSASTLAIIGTTIPIFTLVGETIITKSKISKSSLFSIFVAIIGICFVVNKSVNTLLSDGSGIGYILIFLSVLSWVIYTFITKSLFNYYSGLLIVTYQTIFAALSFLPFAFMERANLSLVNNSISLNILYIGIFPSALAYYFYAEAMNELGVTKSSFYMNLIPIVTIMGGAFFLQEKITWNIILGTGLILLSIIVIQGTNKT